MAVVLEGDAPAAAGRSSLPRLLSWDRNLSPGGGQQEKEHQPVKVKLVTRMIRMNFLLHDHLQMP